MSPFWEGFLSVFDWNNKPKRYPVIKEFEWYHKGPWWEHPIYKIKK